MTATITELDVTVAELEAILNAKAPPPPECWEWKEVEVEVEFLEPEPPKVYLYVDCPVCGVHKEANIHYAPLCYEKGRPRERFRIRPSVRVAWCTALRSGEWEQIRGHWGIEHSNTRCAMGLLLTILGIPLQDRGEGAMGAKVARALGVSRSQLAIITADVIGMNDTELLSFAAIANRIERDY